MGGVIPLLPHIRLWRAGGQLDFYLFYSDFFSLSISFAPLFTLFLLLLLSF